MNETLTDADLDDYVREFGLVLGQPAAWPPNGDDTRQAVARLVLTLREERARIAELEAAIRELVTLRPDGTVESACGCLSEEWEHYMPALFAVRGVLGAHRV